MSNETKTHGGCQASLEPSCSDETGSAPRATLPDEVTPRIIDRKVSLLVAAGSAMASGCEPCMDQLIPNLIEAGVPDGDIRRAVEIGQSVKDAAAEYMKEVADVLAGTRLVGSPEQGQVPTKPATKSGGCCG